MVVVFRLVYLCAALLAIASGGLVIASLFIQDRGPQTTEMLGIHLAVGAVFLGVGALLLGIQRHLARIAALAHGADGDRMRELAAHLSRLLAYLLAGGTFLCAVLGAMTYGILERIGQGFAVFG
jgi:mannitol-specific phosphotransferase system IIBC component